MLVYTITDAEVKHLVRGKLDKAPLVNSARVGVSVDRGAVTLHGEVSSDAERLAAKDAALQVKIVRALVNHLVVHADDATPRSDADLARAVSAALREYPTDTVKARVGAHIVTLQGAAADNATRVAIERSVGYLSGVYAVNNDIACAEESGTTSNGGGGPSSEPSR